MTRDTYLAESRRLALLVEQKKRQMDRAAFNMREFGEGRTPAMVRAFEYARTQLWDALDAKALLQVQYIDERIAEATGAAV